MVSAPRASATAVMLSCGFAGGAGGRQAEMLCPVPERPGRNLLAAGTCDLVKTFPASTPVGLHQADGLIASRASLLASLNQTPEKIAVNVIGAGSGFTSRNFVECLADLVE